MSQNFSATTKLKLSPFFERTGKLNQSQEWRRWGGYLSATQYDLHHENEYFAIRTKAALFDISPLYKYSISGEDSTFLLNKLITRDLTKCKVGQVMYTPWCNEEGKVIDDGTIQRLKESKYLLTSAEPNLTWLNENAMGFNTSIKDVSKSISALSLQGPNSLKILNTISDKPINNLKFFWLTNIKLNDIPVTISRTGYTGDLGYEIWLSPKDSIKVWDMLIDSGRSFGITPAGLQALDMARIEAALILLDVDYISARHAIIESRKSSPIELGLKWTVNIHNGNDFIGKNVLSNEISTGSKWKFRGIEVKWGPLEKIFNNAGLSPDLPTTAWRNSTPLFKNNEQIGYATSGCWSPILKKYIALAHIQAKHAAIGTNLDFEIKVEHMRTLTAATVVKTPFFNPKRKRSCLT